MILSKADFMKLVKERVGDDTSDESLKFIEDMNDTYNDLENIMKNASIEYFNAHSEYLPKEEGKIVQVDVANLVYEGRMKDLSEYGVGCTGYVLVEKIGVNYVHTPYLSCGEDYATVELYKKVLNDNPVVNEGYGLYNMNNSGVFRGENVNNYVKLENGLWRIVKINSDNTVVLIHNEGLHYNQAWDDRYNESKMYNIGNNQYGNSRIREYLNKVYTNPSEEDLEFINEESDGNFPNHTADPAVEKNMEDLKKKVQARADKIKAIAEKIKANEEIVKNMAFGSELSSSE